MQDDTLSVSQDKYAKGNKCPNLTFNCIWQILDILVALSLVFWSYVLSPKNVGTFSNISEASLAMFISRSIVTLYFASFSIGIVLYTFYYPFQTKSIYFNFYGRAIRFIFLGNLMLLIGCLSDSEEQILKYGYYSAHFVIGVGLVYAISSLITNPKCGLGTNCFLPSPFIQLKHGKRLRFKMRSLSEYDTIKSPETKVEKQVSVVAEETKTKTKTNTAIQKSKVKKLIPSMDRRKSEMLPSKTESFQQRLSIFKNNAKDISQNKVDALKNERKSKEKDMKQNKESKRRATIALQTYATQAASHSKDMNLLHSGLKNVTQNNCMQKMRELGLLFGIYVPINEYQRWDIQSKLDKIVRSAAEEMKESDRDNLNGSKQANTKEYTKMYVVNLRNNALLTKISKDQKEHFYKLLTFAISVVPDLYLMDFTRANMTKPALNIVFEALTKRLKSDRFGPEHLLLESNPITDHGCVEIIQYLKSNPSDLRSLRMSNSFHNIGSQTVVHFCDVMEHNQTLQRFSLDISYLMYRNRLEGYIRRNNKVWRERKKSNPANLVKRKSYDSTVRVSGHKKARRSSVPHLHKTHPSLANIRGRFDFANDKDQKKEKPNRYNFSLEPKKDNKRRRSMPPTPNKNMILKQSIAQAEEKVREDSSSSSDDDLNDLMSGDVFKNAKEDSDDTKIRLHQ